MKTINATRYDQAVKELEAIDKDLSKSLEKEIKEVDRKHYHVALVKVEDRPGQPKNKVSFMVQKYAKHGFEKIQKNFKFHGFNKLILVHDPSLLNEPETKKVPTHVLNKVKAETRKEVLNESDDIEAEIERRVAQRLKEQGFNAGTGVNENNDEATDKKFTDVDGNEVTKESLESDYQKTMSSGKKDDFVNFATKYNVNLETATNNPDREAAITSFYNAQMEIFDLQESNDNQE